MSSGYPTVVSPCHAFCSCLLDCSIVAVHNQIMLHLYSPYTSSLTFFCKESLASSRHVSTHVHSVCVYVAMYQSIYFCLCPPSLTRHHWSLYPSNRYSPFVSRSAFHRLIFSFHPLPLKSMFPLHMQGVYNSWKSWKSPGIYWTSWKFLCKVIDHIGFRS